MKYATKHPTGGFCNKQTLWYSNRRFWCKVHSCHPYTQLIQSGTRKHEKCQNSIFFFVFVVLPKNWNFSTSNHKKTCFFAKKYWSYSIFPINISRNGQIENSYTGSKLAARKSANILVTNLFCTIYILFNLSNFQ